MLKGLRMLASPVRRETGHHRNLGLVMKGLVDVGLLRDLSLRSAAS